MAAMNVLTVRRVNEAAPEDRSAIIDRIERDGFIATPANTVGNTLVTEAGRLSLLNGGRNVRIRYEPEPGVELV